MTYNSDYNNRHLEAIKTSYQACCNLTKDEMAYLRGLSLPYIDFRKQLEDFNTKYFAPYCRYSCFNNKRSACCSPESIVIFFADEVINFLFGRVDDFDKIISKLSLPNSSNYCVYLGDDGCLWTIRPITCAMFFCDDAKKHVFGGRSEASGYWEILLSQEKNFTWPTKPVLFDEMEDFFLRKGVSTSNMYFHRSPGLLRVKQEAKGHKEH